MSVTSISLALFQIHRSITSFFLIYNEEVFISTNLIFIIITWYSTTLMHFNWLINLSWLGIQMTSNLVNNYFNSSNHFNNNFYKAMSYWTLMSLSPSFTLTSRSDLSKQQIWSNDTLLCILLRTKRNTPLPSPEQETLPLQHFTTSLSSSAASSHGLSVYRLQRPGASWTYFMLSYI